MSIVLGRSPQAKTCCSLQGCCCGMLTNFFQAHALSISRHFHSMADYDASWWSKIQTVLLFPLKRQAIEACAT